jgi:hypothetical protein
VPGPGGTRSGPGPAARTPRAEDPVLVADGGPGRAGTGPRRQACHPGGPGLPVPGCPPGRGGVRDLEPFRCPAQRPAVITTHRARRSRPVSDSGALRWTTRTSRMLVLIVVIHTEPGGPHLFKIIHPCRRHQRPWALQLGGACQASAHYGDGGWLKCGHGFASVGGAFKHPPTGSGGELVKRGGPRDGEQRADRLSGVRCRQPQGGGAVACWREMFSIVVRCRDRARPPGSYLGWRHHRRSGMSSTRRHSGRYVGTDGVRSLLIVGGAGELPTDVVSADAPH